VSSPPFTADLFKLYFKLYYILKACFQDSDRAVLKDSFPAQSWFSLWICRLLQ